MIVLGLQFGHDGSACVLKDGRVVSYVYRERESRVKHVIGLTTEEVSKVLERAGVTIEDIDFIAISSTQNVELLTGLIDGFSIVFEHSQAQRAHSPLARTFSEDPAGIGSWLSHLLRDLFAKGMDRDSFQYRVYGELCPERDQVASGQLASTGWLDAYATTPEWESGHTLSAISAMNASSMMNSEVKNGFHYPVSILFHGRRIPGYFVSHHTAHAASCFFQSNFDESAIFTHDGYSTGIGYLSGMIFYGRGNEIIPFMPHYLAVGAVYDAVGVALDLGTIGPAGKLMGLAPYGKPVFYRPAFAGNWYDIQERFGSSHSEAWWQHCISLARSMGYDMSALGVRDRMTEAINADIAASTQKLFEESLIQAVFAMHDLLLNSGLKTRRLCMSGGTALNCPANSRIFRETPFEDMFIEPSCGDDGLAFGAALYVHHHVLGRPRGEIPKTFASPYSGPAYAMEAIEATLHDAGARLSWSIVPNACDQAARELVENKVIGWFEGGSESGPRALGHRSIVANPSIHENWKKVNQIKRREWWRPFAPSVLESESPRWFSGLPAVSPYMLFTGQVNSDRLAAVRHVDGSSRIQTVNESAGAYFQLISAFFQLTGIPVVLNTSFNGPGEPIVETPQQAIDFLLGTELDVLYFEGKYRVERPNG